jgi:sugar O-acyltransferase (sialic acid O-acetyltransferase NeuD family)
MSITPSHPSYILLGAGGHAKVLLALAHALALPMKGACAPEFAAHPHSTWQGVPALGGDDALTHFSPTDIRLINGIGQTVGNDVRKQAYVAQKKAGFLFPAITHPFAWVAPDAMLADGAQVMAGAIIQPGCSIGENSIINTRASIDHDTRVGGHAHIAPGAILCGGVTVDDDAFIGAGATIGPGVHIGKSAIVGAGVTVLYNIVAGQTFVGKNHV